MKFTISVEFDGKETQSLTSGIAEGLFPVIKDFLDKRANPGRAIVSNQYSIMVIKEGTDEVFYLSYVPTKLDDKEFINNGFEKYFFSKTQTNFTAFSPEAAIAIYNDISVLIKEGLDVKYIRIIDYDRFE